MHRMTLAQDPSQRHVLLVEDDATTAELMRRTLEGAGYQTEVAHNVHEGIAALHRNASSLPQALLLDYQLPDGTPWQLADEVQNCAPDLPVVFVTGTSDESVAVEAVRRGFADYVRKRNGFWKELPAVVERATRLREIKGRLDEASQMMRAIVEHSTDLYVVCNANAELVYLSPVCKHMLGIDEQPQSGASWKSFVADEDHTALESAIRKLELEPEQQLTLRCKRTDGILIWAETRVARLITARGIMTLLTLHDITEQRLHEQQMQASLREKEVLLREIYHRVKNNLQVIQSLLKMQGRAMPKGEPRKALESTAQRVYAMALVHEQLYQMEDLTRLSLSEYLRNLFNGAVASNSMPAHKVRLTLDIEEVPLSLDRAIPFGLLVNELICNSIKHGLRELKQGHIRIGIHRTLDGVRLEVEDDGKGLPEGFKLSESSSMGLKLASSLAHQLGGELEFSSTKGCLVQTELSRL